MKVKVRPLADRVLIRRDEPEKVSRGGILLPDTGQQKPQRGTVVSVGPGKRTDHGELLPMGVAAGDKVLFARYAGQSTDLDEQYLVLSEADVLAVILE